MTGRGFEHHPRLYAIAALLALGFGGVAYRLVQLHWLNREHFLSQVQETRLRVVSDPARRGAIYDARGDLLATTRTDLTLAIDPWALLEKLEAQKFEDRKISFAEDQRQARVALADLLAIPVEKLEALYTPKWKLADPLDDLDDEAIDGCVRVRFVKFLEGVTEEKFAAIQAITLPNKNKDKDKNKPVHITGLTFERHFRRVYPHNELAAHIIGFVNKEDKPSGGVEAYADQYLKGLDGWREIERNGKRVELAQFRQREVPPSDGWGVVLSIDAAVQNIAEQEMSALVEKFTPAKATIIVSDAHTGFLMALANFPTFDLNKFGKADLEVQRNIAATDIVEPGSTFKVVTLSGALNESLVTPGTKFDCMLDSLVYNGKPRRFMRDDHRYDHLLTLSEVIAKSSNIGTAQVGMLLGERRLYDYARAFGYGEPSGYPLGHEAPGMLADPDKWSGIDITRIPAGYSVAATPLQIHYGMGVIASGGHLLRPQVIRQIVDAQGEAVYRFRPAIRRTVVAPATAVAMSRMLQKVASPDGTARVAAIPGFEVAGKTGTAQLHIEGVGYSKQKHVGSFVGFFPASRPRVVITVIVYDGHPPSGGTAYGSVVAAPSFRKIAEQLIQYLDIKPVSPLAPSPLVALQTEGARR